DRWTNLSTAIGMMPVCQIGLPRNFCTALTAVTAVKSPVEINTLLTPRLLMEAINVWRDYSNGPFLSELCHRLMDHIGLCFRMVEMFDKLIKVIRLSDHTSMTQQIFWRFNAMINPFQRAVIRNTGRG